MSFFLLQSRQFTEMEYTFNGEPLNQDMRSSSSFCTPPGSPLLSTLSLATPEVHSNDCKKTKRRYKSEPIRGPADTNKSDVKGNHVKKRHSHNVDEDEAEETSILILPEEGVISNHVSHATATRHRDSIESTV